MSNLMKYNKSWIINCFSKLSLNSEHTTSIPLRVDFLNHSLNILADGVNEFIYLTPETYVMQSTFHLGILSFDFCHHGKWVLSFNDLPSAMDFIETLRKNDIKVTDIQKLLSERVHLEDTIIKTVTDVGFPNFVAEVENAMKNKDV
ncbi:uncharacterized protein LOC132952847 [Metopolophium dirhodum]|uniref:uncharacterized protein LOC132952847 n=1 Tax=Metopolophium dirhodum TaxID=44670 RepID=UPI00299074BD|nr:uncharacterized protein LOC132952847 [Metopolophium dirhodum]